MNKTARGCLVAAATAMVLAAVATLLFAWRYGARWGVYLREPSPQEYADAALSLMDEGYYARTDDWREVREMIRGQLAGAASYEETHALLADALSVAGGPHSHLVPANTSPLEASASSPTKPEVTFRADNILVLRLPAFAGDDAAKAAYAEAALAALEEHASTRGVIVDLRGSGGDDLAPLVGAVAPLLPDGDILLVEHADGHRDALTLKGGRFSGGTGITVTAEKLPLRPVALLTDEGTASSAEALVVAFRGSTNVRTFGKATAGLASLNVTRRLYDGTQLILTIGASVAPRTSEVYGDQPIRPDAPCDDPEEEAAAWIRGERLSVAH